MSKLRALLCLGAIVLLAGSFLSAQENKADDKKQPSTTPPRISTDYIGRPRISTTDYSERWKGYTGGKDVWIRSEIKDPALRERFDRYAATLGITNGQLTLNDYMRYIELGGSRTGALADLALADLTLADLTRIGLTEEQLQRIYRAEIDYREKITALQTKIKGLEDEKKTEIDKILTDTQRARLRVLRIAGTIKDDKKP